MGFWLSFGTGPRDYVSASHFVSLSFVCVPATKLRLALLHCDSSNLLSKAL